MDTWEVPTTDFVVVNYEKFSRSTDEAKNFLNNLKKRKFDCIVLDEAHRIRNRKSTCSKNILSLSRRIPHRLALTGTPAYNSPVDLFAILNFLRPDKYSSYYRWVNEWFLMKPTWTPRGMIQQPVCIDPAKHQAFTEELNELSVMRKRDDVLDWDTSQDIVDVALPLTSKQRKYISELTDYFRTEGIICEGVIDRMVRYRQICNAPELLQLSGNSPKIDWILDYLKDSEGQSLIFSSSKKTLNLLANRIAGALVITGDVSTKHRAEIVQDFQNHRCKVLLLQTVACKEGLTLDEADTTIFIDVYPPASDYLQAKDRAVPTDASKVKPRTVYRLMMADSFDSELYNLVDHNVVATDVINHFTKYIGGKDGQGIMEKCTTYTE